METGDPYYKDNNAKLSRCSICLQTYNRPMLEHIRNVCKEMCGMYWKQNRVLIGTSADINYPGIRNLL